ncbi:MAG: Flp family type IVb pilin [Hyphomicrobiales bacterium]
MSLRIRAFIVDQSGATAIEYSLICGLIFLVIVASLYTFQSQMAAVYQTIGNGMASAGN